MENLKVVEPKEYLFAYEEESKGWWYVCNNANDLAWYHMHDTKYGDAVYYYMNHPDIRDDASGPEYMKEADYICRTRKLVYGIKQFALANNMKCSFLEACNVLRMMTAMEQLEKINKHGAIMINSVGGFHKLGHYSQWVIRKSFVFPDYKESDISIKQFKGGTHWYVRIGDMELHQDSNIKWNTKEEAAIAARKYIEKE